MLKNNYNCVTVFFVILWFTIMIDSDASPLTLIRQISVTPLTQTQTRRLAARKASIKPIGDLNVQS